MHQQLQQLQKSIKQKNPPYQGMAILRKKTDNTPGQRTVAIADVARVNYR